MVMWEATDYKLITGEDSMGLISKPRNMYS